MIYKPLGRTGIDASAVGFGGMRFKEEDYASGDLAKCAELLLYAAERGINYFDTAPDYCDDKSEFIYGAALPQLKRDSYYVTSKLSAHTTGDVTAQQAVDRIKRSIERMNCGYLDVIHLWCIIRYDQFEEACLPGHVLDGLVRAKQEGLVRHIAVSTHMPGADIARMLDAYPFESVLLGYNAINFAYREAGLKRAAELGLGVVTMNPLGGGLIPGNPDKFAFLCESPGQSVSSAAIRFNAAHPEITVALCGFSAKEEIDDAVQAVSTPLPDAASRRKIIREKLSGEMNSLCTGCGYCEGCPVELPIPKLMDTYNQYMLSGIDELMGRIALHWRFPDVVALADSCLECGRCEQLCTQSLPIIERIKEVKRLYLENK